MDAVSAVITQGKRWRPARGDWLAAACILAVALVIRGIWIGNPVADFDEQLYSFIGWRLTHGELPYVDWWDRKPFGLFAIFALAHAVGGPSAAAYQVAALLSALVMSAMVYALARRLVDAFAAAIAAILSLMLLSAFGAYSANSEVFFSPVILAMVWLLAEPEHRHARRRALFAMLLGGVALQIKYTVLPQCLALGLVALWQEWQRSRDIKALISRAAAFTALGLLPTAIVATGYALLGHWDEWLFANVLSFFERVAMEGGRTVAYNLIVATPITVLFIGGLYASWRFAPPSNWPLYRLFFIYFVATLGTVFLPATNYLYYYAALAPAVALIAVPLLDRRGPAGPIPALVLAAALAFLINIPDRITSIAEQRQSAQTLTNLIAPHVDGESRCLWIHDGPTALYRLSGSCVPSRFVYPDHLNNALETPALGIDQTAEAARILADKPPVIVTASRAVTPQNEEVMAMVEQTIARDYVEAGSADINFRTITAWVRREDAGKKAEIRSAK